MPESHVDLVRTAFKNAARVRDPSGERFDVLDRDSREVVFAFVHEELEFREDPKFPEGGVYRGVDAARTYFEQFTESFDEFVLENPECVDRISAAVATRAAELDAHRAATAAVAAEGPSSFRERVRRFLRLSAP